MDEAKIFDFLEKDYGLKHSYQSFKNCFNGYWWVYTHSYYNENGCFTIHNLPQRGEIDFYFSKKFSNIREELCEVSIDIQKVGCEIWIRNKPLFGYRQSSMLKTLSEVIKSEIKESGQFFGVKVK